MPRGLRRFHQSEHSHFLTFSCYHRQQKFCSPATYDLFIECLEDMRRRFGMCIYGYVVMPEHVHLLVSEPTRETLTGAMHFLKLAFAKLGRWPSLRLVLVTLAQNMGAPSFAVFEGWEARTATVPEQVPFEFS